MLVRSCTRPILMADEAVGVCRRINAVNAVDLATGLSSVRREEERVGGEEVDVDVVEEEAGMQVEEYQEVRSSLLLWLGRGQMRQGVRCNSPLTRPQCPVAVTRETS